MGCLAREMRKRIKFANQESGSLSIGIDAGVDYGLLDRQDLIGNPYHYRDITDSNRRSFKGWLKDILKNRYCISELIPYINF